MTAWDSFYANRDGIMDELVDDMGEARRVVPRRPRRRRLRPLERAQPRPRRRATRQTALGTFYAKAINAIRAAETTAGSIHHIAFFETTVFGIPVAPGFTADDNIVLRAAQLRRIDRRHADRRPLRLLRRPCLAVRHRHVDRRIRMVQRPARQRREARALRRQGGRTPHRGRHVVAVAAGVRRPALDRHARRNAGRDPDPLPAQRLPG